ncbi:peptidoglycan-binding domain-containing protein [Frankia sp. Cr1]|uniref:peptidoglycan-binding domain-containing protein n=1 Tax=Frankia sp. Cr1 TaxID=3073931 RepID=UPI002AD220F3|nr:peptidoglycan-binding protein [Frankia sp. Cr1]
MVVRGSTLDKVPESSAFARPKRRSSDAPGLLELQRAAGNRAAAALLGPRSIPRGLVQHRDPLAVQRCECQDRQPAEDHGELPAQRSVAPDQIDATAAPATLGAPHRRVTAAVSPSQLLALQRGAGNVAVASRPGLRAAPGATCQKEPLQHVQRSWLDDAEIAAGDAWDAAKEAGSQAGNAVRGAWDSAKEGVSDAAAAVGDTASSAWNAGANAVGDAVDSATSAGAAAGQAATGVVNGVASVAHGAVLTPGTTGAAVTAVQQLLSAAVPGIPLSGVVDAATTAAARAFQAAQGLSADGIVGPKTLEALTAGPSLLAQVRASLPTFSAEQIAMMSRMQAAGGIAGDARGDITKPGLIPVVTPTLPGGGRPGNATACGNQPCPPGDEITATPDISSSAERCIQAQYRTDHPASTVSSNKEYVFLTGRDSREKEALDCLRSNFTAKSGTHPGEPDIWDFTNNTMYEVTTKNGAPFRKGKIAAELLLANKIAADPECGGQFYGPGDWVPAGPCISLGGTDAFMTVANESGILVYTPFRRKKQKQKQEQEQEHPTTDEEKEKEEKLRRQLATIALAVGITLAVALVIVLVVVGVLTAPAWLPVVLAGLGATAVIALIASMHESTSSA